MELFYFDNKSNNVEGKKIGLLFRLPDEDMISDSEMFTDMINQLEIYNFRVDMQRTFMSDCGDTVIDTIYDHAHVTFRIDKYRRLHVFSDSESDYMKDAQKLIINMIGKQIEKVRRRSRNLDSYVHASKFVTILLGVISIIILIYSGYNTTFFILSSLTIISSISILLSLRKLAMYEKSINSMNLYE